MASGGRARYIAQRLEAAAPAPSIIIVTEAHGAQSMLSGSTQSVAAVASRRIEISVK